MNEELFDFGGAINALKNGEWVTRKGWNGKGMYLFLLPGNEEIPKDSVCDKRLRCVVNTEFYGDTFPALPSIRMFTADRKILTGWLASQTDMLAEDWMIV